MTKITFCQYTTVLRKKAFFKILFKVKEALINKKNIKNLHLGKILRLNIYKLAEQNTVKTV
jgi:hypothetical protein